MTVAPQDRYATIWQCLELEQEAAMSRRARRRCRYVAFRKNQHLWVVPGAEPEDRGPRVE